MYSLVGNKRNIKYIGFYVEMQKQILEVLLRYLYLVFICLFVFLIKLERKFQFNM